jgi:hypothetical protein
MMINHKFHFFLTWLADETTVLCPYLAVGRVPDKSKSSQTDVSVFELLSHARSGVLSPEFTYWCSELKYMRVKQINKHFHHLL